MRSWKTYSRADRQRVLADFDQFEQEHHLRPEASELRRDLQAAFGTHYGPLFASAGGLVLDPVDALVELFAGARKAVAAAWSSRCPSFESLHRLVEQTLREPLDNYPKYLALLRASALHGEPRVERLVDHLKNDERGRVVLERALRVVFGLELGRGDVPAFGALLENPGLMHKAEVESRRYLAHALSSARRKMSEQSHAWTVLAYLSDESFQSGSALTDALPSGVAVTLVNDASRGWRAEVHRMGAAGPYLGAWRPSPRGALASLQDLARMVVDLPADRMTVCGWNLRIRALRASGRSSAAWWERVPDLGRLPSVASSAGLDQLAAWLRTHEYRIAAMMEGLPRWRIDRKNGWKTLVDWTEPVGPFDVTRLDVGPVLSSELRRYVGAAVRCEPLRSRPLVVVDPGGGLSVHGWFLIEDEQAHDRLTSVEIAYRAGAECEGLVFDPESCRWSGESLSARVNRSRAVRVRGDDGCLVMHDLRSANCRRLPNTREQAVLLDGVVHEGHHGGVQVEGTTADNDGRHGCWAVVARDSEVEVLEDQATPGRVAVSPRRGWSTSSAILPTREFHRLLLGQCRVFMGRRGHQRRADHYLVEVSLDGWSSVALPYDPVKFGPNPLFRDVDRSSAMASIRVRADAIRAKLDPVRLLEDTEVLDDGAPVVEVVDGRWTVTSGRARALGLLGAPQSAYNSYLRALEAHLPLSELRPTCGVGCRWLLVRLLENEGPEPAPEMELDWWRPLSADGLEAFKRSNPYMVSSESDALEDWERASALTVELLQHAGVAQLNSTLARPANSAVEGVVPALFSLRTLVRAGECEDRYDLLHLLPSAMRLLSEAERNDRGVPAVFQEVAYDWAELRLVDTDLRLSDVEPLAVGLAALLYAASRQTGPASAAARYVEQYARRATATDLEPVEIIASLISPVHVPRRRMVRPKPTWQVPEDIRRLPEASPWPDGGACERIKTAVTSEQGERLWEKAKESGVKFGELVRSAVIEWTKSVLDNIAEKEPVAEIGRASRTRFPVPVTIRLSGSDHRRFLLATAVVGTSAAHCARCALLRLLPVDVALAPDPHP